MSQAVAALKAPHTSDLPAIRTVRIALAGCGVVGSAFVQLLRSEAARLQEAHGLRFELTRILVRNPQRPRPVELQHDLLTSHLADFLDAAADIVVEVVGGVDPAYQIVHAALQRGARVVTANKALLAYAGPELARCAQRQGTTLDFEAAVAAGIPIIRTLRSTLAGQPVRSVRGILNGTTNFILNAMERGASLDHALREAQQLGFAEADATRDLNGTDARDKLSVLAWLTWGVAPRALQVRQRGIDVAADLVVRDAEAVGGTLRLMASCERVGRELRASVEPIVVARNSDAGRILGENNFVRLEFDELAPLNFSGPGAGGLPTARAVFADVLQACGSLPDSSSLLTSRPDAEPHKWLLGAHTSGARVCAALHELDIALQTVDNTPAATRMIAGPCAWSELAPLLQTSQARGDQLRVARLELDV